MKAKKYRDNGLSIGINDNSRISNDYNNSKDFEALFYSNFDIIDFPS